ncbi:MAG: DUF6785 family protein, partial [Planctomycetota bacterium]
MTRRAILIGLVLAVALCCITYFNQSVMRQTPLVGDYLPISVFGTLILVILLLNPLIALASAGVAARRPWLRSAGVTGAAALVFAGGLAAIAAHSWSGLLIGLLVGASVFAISGAAAALAGEWRSAVTAAGTFLVTGVIVLAYAGLLAALIAAVSVSVLAGLVSSGRPLRGRELAVSLSLVLISCGIAEYGILKTFTNVLMLPRMHRKTHPEWDHEGVFERLPGHMLAEPGERDEALGGFLQGKTGNVPVSPSDVPWDAWVTPIFTWLPIVLLITIGFIALALVMHRQ